MATSMQTDPDEVIQVREAQKRGARVSTIEYRFAPDPEVTTSQQARAKVDETVAAGGAGTRGSVVRGSLPRAGRSVKAYAP